MQFTIIIYSDLSVFHPWIISNTQKKELLRSIMLMPVLYKADTFQLSYWICSKKSVLAQPQLPGLLEGAAMSCLYWKEWLVPGWWEGKVRFLTLPDPLAKTHSLPRVFPRPPASITAFSKKLEAIREEKQHEDMWERDDRRDLGNTKRRNTEIELSHYFRRTSTNEGE